MSSPWQGAAAHWGAIGAMSMAAMAQREATRAQFKQETPVIETPACEKCRFHLSKIDTYEGSLSRANATIDDQAAQIVALQATLDLSAPRSTQGGDTIARLQASDAVQRDNLLALERRLHQLLEHLRVNEMEIPSEPASYMGPYGSS